MKDMEYFRGGTMSRIQTPERLLSSNVGFYVTLLVVLATSAYFTWDDILGFIQDLVALL